MSPPRASISYSGSAICSIRFDAAPAGRATVRVQQPAARLGSGGAKAPLQGLGLPRGACGSRRQCRQPVFVAASSGGGGSDDSETVELSDAALKGRRLKMQFELLMQLIVRYPALIGSVAVAAGFLLKIDALGNFHWNMHDAQLGLQCALPIMVLDAALMLPDYSPGSTTKTIKLKAPKSVAEMLQRQEEGSKAAGQQQEQQKEENGGDAASVASSSVAATAQQQQQQSASDQAATSQQQQDQAGGQAEGDEDLELPGGALLNAVIVVDDEIGPISISVEQQETESESESEADGRRSSSNSSSSSSSSGTEASALAASVAAVNSAAVLATEEAAAEAAEGASKQGEELVEIEKTISVRGEQPPWLAALYRVQLEKAMENVGRVLPYPMEVVLLLTWHLAEEMLYRGIVLTWAVGWTIDRLYEAGADETVGMLSWQLATPQAGAVLAAVGCTTVSLAILVQRALFPLKLISMADKDLEEKEAQEAERDAAAKRIAGLSGGGLPARRDKGGNLVPSDEERKRMRKVLDKVKGGLVRQRKWSTAVEGSRDVVEWAAYSTSYLLTGNLLAPYVTAISADLLFSGYQRYKRRQVDEAQAQSMQTIKDLHTTAMAIKKARTSVLQPPAASDKEGRGETGSSSNGNGSNGSGSNSSDTDADAEAAGEAAKEGAAKVPAAEDAVGARTTGSSKSSEGKE